MALAISPKICNNWEMTKSIAEKLDKLDQLYEINKTLQEILAAVTKPKENKFVRAMELIVLFGGISIFLTAIDIIRNWIIGG